MFDWLNLRVDGISFFLGAAAGTLFWYLIAQFNKSVFPPLVAAGKRKFKEFKNRNFIAADFAIRQDALRRAQKSHLAAPLFSLDEILIPPRLIPAPYHFQTSQENEAGLQALPALPYLPDWPAIASHYQVDLPSLTQCAEHGADLLIIAQPGAGKTTCLAHFASELARKISSHSDTPSKTPIFLHVADLQTLPALPEQDILSPISKAIAANLPIFVQNQIPKLLNTLLSEGKAILLLDGPDEYPAAQIQEIGQYLLTLKKQYPRLQMISTATPENLSGLLPVGFLLVSLADWTLSGQTQFIQHWGSNWQKRIQPEWVRKSSLELVDPLFINHWVKPDGLQRTPLEWTVALWEIYAGEGGKPDPMPILDTVLARALPNLALRQSVQRFALHLIKSKQVTFSQSEAERFVAQFNQPANQIYDPSLAPSENNPNANQNSPKKESINGTSQWIASCVQMGILQEHHGRTFRFSHSIFLAYLASAVAEINLDMPTWLPDLNSWQAIYLAAGYFYARNPDQFSIGHQLFNGKPPFFTETLAASRWLRLMPPSLPSRSRWMKRLADGVMDEILFFSTRLRFMSALIATQDGSLPELFRRLLAFSNPTTRAIACIAVGLLHDQKSQPLLANLLSDSDPVVRRLACYALGELYANTSLALLTECLSADDELLRLASAETLARDPLRGYAILEKEAQSENLLVRRSVVFGLLHIRETWAHNLLEQLAIQDGQWVVRNAAAQALEFIQKPDHPFLEPPIAPSETPWLFAYAAKIGKGIPHNDPAEDILLHALESGTIDEKRASLDFLKSMPGEEVYASLLKTARDAPAPVNEAAQFALWYVEKRYPNADHAKYTLADAAVTWASNRS